MDRQDPRSTGSLLTDVLGSIGNLLRQEVDLARAEVDENLKKAGKALFLLIGALILAFIGLSVLSTAAISALVLAGIGSLWATIIVGLVVLVIAGILGSVGIKRLKLSSIAPSRAARNLKADINMMKEAYNDR
ncbi:Putative Holin-X, holin superfamily III [Loktanella fryxellensis]|uniref:Putative Holin-X, holin superfamily III n=1 Tax=Loktanella fryxellensis TaxID=245187 RepID=A0A1H8CU40_9RHOB|nr:phage holin family protein [Loktanella fryxellensis]SEM98575.1 Putative Holin-X, holin superfamily III [Loktanella fryxellensis]